MSFRTRLTSFFVVIVVVPMVAVGVLVYSLISDSEHAKAEARANGLVSAAVAQYASASSAARADAATIARNPSLIDERWKRRSRFRDRGAGRPGAAEGRRRVEGRCGRWVEDGDRAW